MIDDRSKKINHRENIFLERLILEDAILEREEHPIIVAIYEKMLFSAVWLAALLTVSVRLCCHPRTTNLILVPIRHARRSWRLRARSLVWR